MTSIANSVVTIQTSPQEVPSPPAWFGELTVIAHFLQQQGVLAAIAEHVRFARRRLGRYEVIDFVAVLFGYAISGERALEAFYQHVQPFATAFMALFGRERLPARSTLSRFLASLTPPAVDVVALYLHRGAYAPALADEDQEQDPDRWCSHSPVGQELWQIILQW